MWRKPTPGKSPRRAGRLRPVHHPGLLLFNDPNLDGSGDFRLELHFNRVNAQSLDRMLDVNHATADGEAGLLENSGHVVGGDGTKKLVAPAHFAGNRAGEVREFLREILGD